MIAHVFPGMLSERSDVSPQLITLHLLVALSLLRLLRQQLVLLLLPTGLTTDASWSCC